jgi:poly-gamma-glutamate synthesis protein (capsule biosynthesis protein)
MNTAKLFAVGDIVIDHPASTIISADLQQLIKTSDIAVCNFEGSIKSDGSPIPKAGPHIYQHAQALKFLKNCGFTHCSIANNHIYDFGESGLKKTLSEAALASLDVFGAGLSWQEAYAPKFQNVNGIRVGLLAFCEAEFGCLIEHENRGGYAYVNHGSVCKIITDTKANSDILIVFVHAGVEYVPLPLPEWRLRYRELCDYGADAVIAHHPHVPQGWEAYSGKPIFYSLGNFLLNHKSVRENQDYSYSVILEMDKDNITDFEIICHKPINNSITRINDINAKEDLNRLCYMLATDYINLVNKQTIHLYENRYKKYYIDAILGLSDSWSFLKKCKEIIKRLLFPRREAMQRGLLLLHNIRIDSHRYVVQRALSLLWEKYE